MRRTRTRKLESASEPELRPMMVRGGAEKVNIPTDLLRTFVAIYETGSFTKAAHLFDLTQPAVSAHMRRLETLIGGDLMEKNVSGVSLTECGEEVLRHARRILLINDQIVSAGGEQANPHMIRIGIPNIFAGTKLRPLIDACRDNVGDARTKFCCDSSPTLLRNIRAGYLDLAFTVVGESELKNAIRSWPEELRWVRSPDFVIDPNKPVPLVSSPNLLASDRMAIAALDKAHRPYEVIFTAFDMMARRAAVAAGLGYLPMLRPFTPPEFVIEKPGILPALGTIRLGIMARDDLDTSGLSWLLAAFEKVFSSPQE